MMNFFPPGSNEEYFFAGEKTNKSLLYINSADSESQQEANFYDFLSSRLFSKRNLCVPHLNPHKGFGAGARHPSQPHTERGVVCALSDTVDCPDSFLDSAKDFCFADSAFAPLPHLQRVGGLGRGHAAAPPNGLLPAIRQRHGQFRNRLLFKIGGGWVRPDSPPPPAPEGGGFTPDSHCRGWFPAGLSGS